MATTASAKNWSPYYERYQFLLASPSVWGDGMAGFAQPATLTFLERPEVQFHWSTPTTRVTGFDDWALVTGFQHLGYSVQSRNTSGVTSVDHAISAGWGSDAVAFGAQYGFGAGDAAPQNWFAFGGVLRPDRRLSLSITGRYGVDGPEYEWITEAGVRPLGNRKLTVFGDLAWQGHDRLEDAPWSAGAAAQLIEGVDLVGRYFDGGGMTLALHLNFGRTGVSSQSYVGSDDEYSHQSWSVRAGGLRPGLATGRMAEGRHYVSLHPKGRVRYLKYRWFDMGGTRLYDLLSDIRAAAADPRIATIALNLSGVKLLPEHAWEVRVALAAARQAGKTVLVYIDHAGMTNYHLASVADRVFMDPYGSLLLPGYALHRTYFRGTLEKLGLAFDEWRYYRYKSAAESLVRDQMSEADREQSQAFVDDWYDVTAREVCASRHMERATYDGLIDNGMLFTADSALSAGLVDTLARWSDLGAIVRAHSGRKLKAMAPGDLLEHALDPDLWGETPRVALVYGLGVCDMDKGIRARHLVRVFKSLARDRRVKAVVFRVDSPGGDPLASDLVAEALRACSQRKPVIVSQGQVAASGGYAISVTADSILAGPSTVTGSIGIIGGWLYDQGFTSKLGMTSDIVSRGLHADYDAGVNLPFLGVRIPREPLSDSETARVQVLMEDLYRRFVGQVAAARTLSPDSVNKLAEGRVYSGLDGNSVGLVDGIGGLLLGIEWAAARAGLKPDERIQVVEYPPSAGLFSWPWRMSGEKSERAVESWEETLDLVGRLNGQPLMLLTPGAYPDGE